LLVQKNNSVLERSFIAYRLHPYHKKLSLRRLRENRSDEKPLAIVEARRTSRDPLVGERQATDYVDLIQASYGFGPIQIRW